MAPAVVFLASNEAGFTTEPPYSSMAAKAPGNPVGPAEFQPVVIITGAAGAIGEAVARRVARAGGSLALLDAEQQLPSVDYQLPGAGSLARLAEELAPLADNVVFETVDVTAEGHLQSAIQRAVADIGLPTSLVVAAGIQSIRQGSLIEDPDWRQVIDVNLTGAWKAAQAAAPFIAENGGGSITIVGSVLGHRGRAGLAHYVASKHGLIGLMRTLAIGESDLHGSA